MKTLERGCCFFCLRKFAGMKLIPVPSLPCECGSTPRKHTIDAHAKNCRLAVCPACSADDMEDMRDDLLQRWAKDELACAAKGIELQRLPVTEVEANVQH